MLTPVAIHSEIGCSRWWNRLANILAVSWTSGHATWRTKNREMLGAQVTATILLLSKRDVESDFKSRSLRSDVIRVLIQCRLPCLFCALWCAPALCNDRRCQSRICNARLATAAGLWLAALDRSLGEKIKFSSSVQNLSLFLKLGETRWSLARYCYVKASISEVWAVSPTCVSLPMRDQRIVKSISLLFQLFASKLWRIKE